MNAFAIPPELVRVLSMTKFPNLEDLSKKTETFLHPPFVWRQVDGGTVFLEDASPDGGTVGGEYLVRDFAIAEFPVTNAQYVKFLHSENGFANPRWWGFSPEATRWRQDHPNPKPTAFNGAGLPRTRVSWFDSLAFCAWLTAELAHDLSTNLVIRLPTEQEWQRAALGDTGWSYPWGEALDEKRSNYANHVGKPSPVEQYPDGKSVYGVMDLTGNVWEWCLTGWGQESIDLQGYTYRIIKGGAWNIDNPDHLRANDRGSHPPRGRLNDCGFRVLLGDPFYPVHSP